MKKAELEKLVKEQNETISLLQKENAKLNKMVAMAKSVIEKELENIRLRNAHEKTANATQA